MSGEGGGREGVVSNDGDTRSSSGRNPPEAISSSIEEELERSGIDPSNPEILRAVEIVLSKFYSGPLMLPPAFVLEEYKREFPDIVPKMMEWTDRQVAHRHSIESLIVHSTERRKDRAQIGAAAVALLGMAFATMTGVYGSALAACVIAVVAVGGPVAAYTLASKLDLGANSRDEMRKEAERR